MIRIIIFSLFYLLFFLSYEWNMDVPKSIA